MPTLTTNYSLNKPLVADAIDEDLWGGYLNDNFDSLDSLIKDVDDVTYYVTAAKSANYTVLTSDRNKVLLVDATAGNITITLPASAAATSGYEVTIKKIDSSTNTVTIDGDASETIDGSSTYVLRNQYDVAVLIADATNWSIKSKIEPAALGSGVKAYQSSATSTLSVASWVVIGMDAEDYDDNTYHDTSSNNSRLTFNFTGRVHITGQIVIPNTNNGIFGVKIRKNGSADVAVHTVSLSSASQPTLQVSGDFSVTSGDYFELYAYNGSAPSVNSSAGIGNTFISAFRTK